MSNHEYVRYILKTPNGYLTSDSTTTDITSKDIIVLNILEVGGFLASKEEQVQNFLKRSTEVFGVEECEVISYICRLGIFYSCNDCFHKSICSFWNNRSIDDFI